MTWTCAPGRKTYIVSALLVPGKMTKFLRFKNPISIVNKIAGSCLVWNSTKIKQKNYTLAIGWSRCQDFIRMLLAEQWFPGKTMCAFTLFFRAPNDLVNFLFAPFESSFTLLPLIKIQLVLIYVIELFLQSLYLSLLYKPVHKKWKYCSRYTKNVHVVFKFHTDLATIYNIQNNDFPSLILHCDDLFTVIIWFCVVVLCSSIAVSKLEPDLRKSLQEKFGDSLPRVFYNKGLWWMLAGY